jgi:hypothetical protein
MTRVVYRHILVHQEVVVRNQHKIIITYKKIYVF